MTIEIGITDDLANTQFAPLVALSAHYQQNGYLEPLTGVKIPMRRRDFSAADKFIQILTSMLAGCRTLSEVNLRLRSEIGLAKLWGWERIADQSSLSRTLDALTQKNIEQLRESVTQIRRQHSQMNGRDWRSYLWLDFDLSGLPCSAGAEASQKGYFSDKKTQRGVN
jgi:predicted DNA binding protein